MRLTRAVENVARVLEWIGRTLSDEQAARFSRFRTIELDIDGARDRLLRLEAQVDKLESACPGILKVSCPHTSCTDPKHVTPNR
jgi:hypothetical protein